MLTIKEVIKTLYNALLQRLKKHRGNWEQNDPTADDYIKNRPFYTDESKKETIVKPTTFTAEDPYWRGSPFAFIPVIGNIYKVTWNDKEYICPCYVSWGAPSIGNAAINESGLDTGEPFFYFWYDSDEYGMTVRDQGEHTVTIEKINVTKIDERYLPSNLVKQGSFDELYDYVSYLDDEIWKKVSYTQSQNLSQSQKLTARTNIGAGTSNFDGNYNSLTNKPNLTTVATSGDYNDLINKPTVPTNIVNGEAVGSLRTVNAKESGTYPIGANALSLGSSSEAPGNHSAAFGYGTTAHTQNEFVLGSYNTEESLQYSINNLNGWTGNPSHYSELICYKINGTPSFNEVTGIFTAESLTEIKYRELKTGDLMVTEESLQFDLYCEYTGLTTQGYRFQTYKAQSPREKKGTYSFVIGNGASIVARSNAHTVDWSGLGWFAGGLKIGGTGQDDENAVSVLTENDLTAITESEIDAICGQII